MPSTAGAPQHASPQIAKLWFPGQSRWKNIYPNGGYAVCYQVEATKKITKQRFQTRLQADAFWENLSSSHLAPRGLRLVGECNVAEAFPGLSRNDTEYGWELLGEALAFDDRTLRSRSLPMPMGQPDFPLAPLAAAMAPHLPRARAQGASAGKRKRAVPAAAGKRSKGRPSKRSAEGGLSNLMASEGALEGEEEAEEEEDSMGASALSLLALAAKTNLASGGGGSSSSSSGGGGGGGGGDSGGGEGGGAGAGAGAGLLSQGSAQLEAVVEEEEDGSEDTDDEGGRGRGSSTLAHAPLLAAAPHPAPLRQLPAPSQAPALAAPEGGLDAQGASGASAVGGAADAASALV